MRRNVHAWWDRTPEGLKREWRASKFGRNWTMRSQARGEERWTTHDPLPLAVLADFRDLMHRKYQRRRATYEDFAEIDRLLQERERVEGPARPRDAQGEGGTRETGFSGLQD